MTMNNAADEIVILSDALEALRLRTEELEQKLDTTAQPLAAASVALGGALDGIKALQFHVRDSNLGALSGRIEELRASVAEKIAAFSTQLIDADKRLESEQRQNVDGLRVELGAIGSAVAALSKKFDSELARIETDAKAEFLRIEQIKLQVGPEGRSLNPRGTFVDGETYNRLDVVSWLGSSYIAAVDGVTEKPSRNSNQWQVLASRGGGAGGVGDFASLAGVAQINQGGTGQTTRAAALNALLPSQTGATQYVLLTDGSGNVSWGAQPVAGLPSQTSNGGKLLTTDGTNASWSGAVTVSGSNATVAGTLSSAGDLFVTGTSAQVILGQSSGSALTYYIRPSQAGGAIQIVQDSATVNRWLSLGGVNNNAVYTESLRITNGGHVAVTNTTASTSTSTGALVVSGGVGVAGAVNTGGGFSTVGAMTLPAAWTAAYGLGLSSDSNVSKVWYGDGTGKELQFISRTGSTNTVRMTLTDTGALTVTGNVGITATTASTSTGTGALTCSGGVGVAGAIYAGGKVVVNGGDAGAAQFAVASASGTIAANLTAGSTTNQSFGLRMFAGTSASDYGLFLRNVTDTTTLFKVDGVGGTTVGGTLTVSAGSLVVDHVGSSSPTLSLSANGSVQSRFFSNGSNTFLESYTSTPLILRTNQTTALTITSGQQVQVNATTASSSTTTGALVVSGGVGVGGQINAAGAVSSIPSSAANGTEYVGLSAQIGSDATLSSCRVTIGALPSATAASRYGFITCFDNGDWRRLYIGGSPGVAPNGGQVLIPATLSSTSTSSGALVVSGGVGVAGAGYFGGIISAATAGSVFTTRLFINASTRNQTLTDGTGITGSNTADDLALRNDSGKIYLAAGGAVPQFTLTTTLATFDTAIKTAAPSGGTAANWKLGTVATVSPTSPNRTIEVDIGGTIYYIHAKTTNN